MPPTSAALDRGREALAAGQWVEARAAFEDALNQGGSWQALDGLGKTLWWLGETWTGLEARSRAYALGRRDGSLGPAARIAAWLAREHWILFRNEAAAAGWTARARRAAEGVDDPGATGWVKLAQAELAAEPGQAIELAGQSAELARGHDTDLEITALARLGVLGIAAGQVERSIAALDESMAAATSGEGLDPQSIAEACCALTEATDLLGDDERLSKWGQVIDSYASAYDFGPLAFAGTGGLHGTLSSFCGACCGGVYLVTGRIDEAEDELVSAITRLQASGQSSRCVHPAAQLAEVRIVQGRHEEARALLDPYCDLPEVAMQLAVLDLELGQPESACVRARARIGELAGQDVAAMPYWLLLVDAQLAVNDVDAAVHALHAAASAAQVTGSRRHQAEVLLAQGKVARARRDADASEILRQASLSLSQASMPLLAARARLELGHLLADTDRPTAVSETRAALASFDRLGASTDADRAAAHLRALGVRGRTGAKNAGRLSNREQEVLRLISDGLSNVEIAQRLFISPKTAGHHVSNILTKLGLRSRTEAAAWAVLHAGS